MKTAISIPDRLFEAAERLARRLGMSRSELYTKAVSQFVVANRFFGVREQLNEVYATRPDLSKLDPAIVQLQIESLPECDW